MTIIDSGASENWRDWVTIQLLAEIGRAGFAVRPAKPIPEIYMMFFVRDEEGEEDFITLAYREV